MVGKRDDSETLDATGFLNHIYSVSIDPGRMVELVESWERQLGQAPAPDLEPQARSRAAAFSGHDHVIDALDKVISAHASRIAELLAGFRTAALIFNARGLIVAVNDAATAVFNIMPGHRLLDLSVDHADYAPLEDQIAGLVAAKDCGNAIVRFKQEGSRTTVLAHLRAIDAEASGRHVIMVTSEHKWPDELTVLLATSYGITDREASVLQSITRGETATDIAASTGRSAATIRTQIQSLLQKTQLGSQLELVRLATTLLHSTGGPAFGEASAKITPKLPDYVLTPLPLPDGRTLHYRVAGAADGQPFLLLPSGQGFIRWTDDAERDMQRRGLQMIVPVRAGYGPSSACPEHANIYDVAADDVAMLLGHLGVQSCPAVAICDDLKIALHTEMRHPGLFTAIIGAAATMPLKTPEQFSRLTKFVRFIQMNATYAPRTLPYVSLLFFHMARRLGTRRFLETMMSSCPADVRALQNPTISEPMEASTEIVLTQHFMAHHSWSREIVEFAKPWAKLLLDCKTPITLFSGTGDPFSPIATVREYCAQKPDIKLTEIADAGQTLVYTHPRLVLDAVDAALA
jgi:pimeloyl-ACP methyl ester carboxylesterase/DNA-binding CsgD family transcriptional regulator